MGFIQISKTLLTPPLYGSFPLDHDGECTSLMKAYLHCLQTHHYEQSQCKNMAKVYLQCRMDRSLFQSREMRDLGFQKLYSETQTIEQLKKQ